jgi:flagellar basal-body rod protein FlgB
MSEGAPLMNTLESFLRLTTSRERAISANMANVDTPGYRTRDINFQQELNRATNFSNTEWKGETGSAQLSPAVTEVPGLMERADGNNVDIDRESLVMAETQLQYQMGIQLIKRQFHQILSAINGN